MTFPHHKDVLRVNGSLWKWQAWFNDDGDEFFIESREAFHTARDAADDWAENGRVHCWHTDPSLEGKEPVKVLLGKYTPHGWKDLAEVADGTRGEPRNPL